TGSIPVEHTLRLFLSLGDIGSQLGFDSCCAASSPLHALRPKCVRICWLRPLTSTDVRYRPGRSGGISRNNKKISFGYQCVSSSACFLSTPSLRLSRAQLAAVPDGGANSGRSACLLLCSLAHENEWRPDCGMHHIRFGPVDHCHHRAPERFCST